MQLLPALAALVTGRAQRAQRERWEFAAIASCTGHGGYAAMYVGG